MKIANISVELVDVMGSDLSVVNAARVSFDKFHEIFDSSDTKLISYLAEHNHWSPFAHTALQFRIKAPIFVARQLVKHQVGGVWNEVSRRYVDSEPEFYFPDVWRKKAENVKQGSKDDKADDMYRSVVFRPTREFPSRTLDMPVAVKELIAEIEGYYTSLLKLGVCAEQARMILPLNTMTEWIWTGSLYFFARVCNLRLDPHAQKECRDVAQLLSEHCSRKFPESWKVLVNVKNNG